MARVLILNEAEVRVALPPEECERAMADVLAARARGEAYNPLRSFMAAPGAPGLMGLMPAHGHDAYALKAICVTPGNPRRGLDSHQGTVTLFDGDTGVPTAILNASAVTEIRTAAVTAVATRRLARADAGTLAVLGAGVQGRSHLRALRDVRPWREIRVHAPTAPHAAAVAEQDERATTAGSAAEAIAGADVVVTATTARTPIIDHAWLTPGAHVNAVGASTVNARELDTATVAAAALFCDSRESLRHEAGEFAHAIGERAITGEDHVQAELGEVLTGAHPGRTADDQLTLFRSLGIGVEDLAAARVAVANARALNLGTEVEL